LRLGRSVGGDLTGRMVGLEEVQVVSWLRFEIPAPRIPVVERFGAAPEL
jgi:hypothetical protein